MLCDYCAQVQMVKLLKIELETKFFLKKSHFQDCRMYIYRGNKNKMLCDYCAQVQMVKLLKIELETKFFFKNVQNFMLIPKITLSRL